MHAQDDSKNYGMHLRQTDPPSLSECRLLVPRRENALSFYGLVCYMLLAIFLVDCTSTPCTKSAIIRTTEWVFVNPLPFVQPLCPSRSAKNGFKHTFTRQTTNADALCTGLKRVGKATFHAFSIKTGWWCHTHKTIFVSQQFRNVDHLLLLHVY